VDILRKYGVATHIYIPIIKRSSVDYAVGADWTPAAGDVKISKDGGAAANVTNLPVAIAMGNTAMWDFSLTATEMQAAQVMITVADSATKAVEDQFILISTFGNASGQYQVDLSDVVRMGLTALPNATPGAAGGVFIAGSNAATSVTTALTANIIGNVTGNLSGSVGSVTGLTASNLDTTVSSRLASASYTAPLSAAGVRTAVGLASANLDTQLAAIDTDTGDIAAIKAKTDSLTFTVANQIDANIQAVNDVALVGNGSGVPFNV
jgi:hypothetical protein